MGRTRQAEVRPSRTLSWQPQQHRPRLREVKEGVLEHDDSPLDLEYGSILGSAPCVGIFLYICVSAVVVAGDYGVTGRI